MIRYFAMPDSSAVCKYVEGLDLALCAAPVGPSQA